MGHLSIQVRYPKLICRRLHQHSSGRINGLRKVLTATRWIMSYGRGVKLVGFWGRHCTYEQLCRGPHEVFEWEITTSPGNDLSNVARIKVDLQKKERLSPLQHLRTIVIRTTNRVLWLHQVMLSPNEKNMYLTSVACGEKFKRLFDDEPLQYCRNS